MWVCMPHTNINTTFSRIKWRLTIYHLLFCNHIIGKRSIALTALASTVLFVLLDSLLRTLSRNEFFSYRKRKDSFLMAPWGGKNDALAPYLLLTKYLYDPLCGLFVTGMPAHWKCYLWMTWSHYLHKFLTLSMKNNIQRTRHSILTRLDGLKANTDHLIRCMKLLYNMYKKRREEKRELLQWRSMLEQHIEHTYKRSTQGMMYLDKCM